MRILGSPLVLAALLLGLGSAMASQAYAVVENLDVATVSMTNATTPKLTANKLCYTDGRDVACDGAAASLSTSSTVYATQFVGDGSGLTNISASGIVGLSQDRITSSTSGVYVSDTGVISLVTAGSTPGYLNAAGLTINGISTTGTISTTNLHVTGNARLAAGHLNMNSTYRVQWGANGINYITGDSTAANLQFAVSGTEALRIVSNGYVGIGTTTPAGRLDIAAAADIISSGLVLTSTSGTGAFRMSIYPVQQYSTTMRVNSSGAFNIQGSLGNQLATFNASTNGVGIMMNNTPSATLHVSGTLMIADGGQACDTSRLGAIKYVGSAFYICQNASNGWEALSTSGANSLDDRITSNSQAGVIANATGYISLTTGGVTGTVYFAPNGRLVTTEISTTGTISTTQLMAYTPIQGNFIGYFRDNGRSADLAISAPNGNHMRIMAGAGDDLSLGASSTEAMRITSTGLVGIGTTNPANPLEVSGNVSIQNGHILMGSGYGIRYAGGASAFRSSGDSPTIVNGGAVGLIMDSNRNVGIGIGTNAASATIHVSGTAYITSALTVNVTPSYSNAVLDIASANDNATTAIFRRAPGSGAASQFLFINNNVSGNTLASYSPASNGKRLLIANTTDSSNTSTTNPMDILLGVMGRTVLDVNTVGVHIKNNSPGYSQYTPSASLHVDGSILLGAETSSTLNTCDTNRLGAIKYEGSAFYICQNAGNGWETLSTSGPNSLDDRITSNSQAGVIANSTGYISLTTGGVTGTVYFAPNGRLVTTEISTTGKVSTTGLYSSAGGIFMGTVAAAGDFIINSNSTQSLMWGYGNNLSIQANASSQNMFFRASGSTVMTLTSGSLVGIGTSQPSATFDVYSNAIFGKPGMPTPLMFRRPTDGNTTTYFRYDQGYALPTSDFGIYHGTGGGTFSVNLNNNGASSPFMRVSGYDGSSQIPGVIIGTSATYPSSTLHIMGVADVVSGGLTIGANTGNAIRMQLYPKGTSSMQTNLLNGGVWDIATSNGNSIVRFDTITRGLSVGTSSTPSTTIHSAGSIRIGSESSSTLAVCDTDRLGAIKYQSGSFYVCGSTLNGWEPLATATSSTTPSISTGASGSLVYRNEFGYLYATNTLSISSTTGSVGIGAGAPASTGSNGLYAVGTIQSGFGFYAPYSTGFFGWNGANRILGDGNATNQNINFVVSGTEALRIVSSGWVGIGTTAPRAPLQINHTSFTTAFAVDRSGVGTAGISLVGTIGPVSGSINFGFTDKSTGSERLSGGLTIISQTNYVGIGGTNGLIMPSSTLHVKGNIQISAGTESCDTDRLGAIRYLSGAFQLCQNTSNGWEAMATSGANSLADRITSNSQAGVIANSTGYISLTTGGVTNTAYFTPSARLVIPQISTTGVVSVTDLAIANSVVNGILYRPSGFSGLISSSINFRYLNDRTLQTTDLGTAGEGSILGFGMYFDPTALIYKYRNNNQAAGMIRLGDQAASEGGDIQFTTFAYNAAGQDVSATPLNRMVIKNSGNVGIATRVPSATLHIQGTLLTTSWTYLNATPSIRVTPTAPLEVSGTVSATRFVGDGSLLTGLSPGVTTFASLTDVSSSAGAGNIFGPGSLTGATSAVTQTTAFGQGALSSASNSGNNNSAFGRSTLANNTSGYQNTAIGAYALVSNTTGHSNAAFGVSTLGANTTGYQNTAFGLNTMLLNVDGYGNTALGNKSMRDNSSGYFNISVGSSSMLRNTTGINNTVIGTSAMQNNKIGSVNVVLGYSAGLGVPNTSIISTSVLLGAYAGQALTVAQSNTLIGYNAGGAITSGNNNIVIGTNLSPFSNTGDNQLNIGDSIFGDMRGALASRIGINVTSPTTSLEVSGTISATAIYIGGQAVSAGGSADRIVSGSTNVTVISNTGYVSLSTGGSNWGYFGSTASYLPQLSAGQISSTNVSTSIITFAGVSGSAGVSLTVSGADNLGNHTATQNLAMGGFSITGLLNTSATGNISANMFIGSGAGLTDIPASAVTGLNLDRISSGTTAMSAANSGFISITTVSATWGYFGSTGSFLPILNSNQVSATNVSTTMITFAATAGSAGVSLTVDGADNLGNHTATQDLAMGGFNITGLLNVNATGTVTATLFSGSGAGLTNIPASAVTGLNLDRISSGTTIMAAISNTSYISLTTAGSNWGYFGSTASYLPYLTSLRISTTAVSATNISVTMLAFNGVSSTGGVSLTVSGDNLGNHTATQNLDMANFNILNVGTISATGLTINGQAVGGGSSGDRITSGSTIMAAISATSYISITTGGTNWGYFGSTASYLPYLTSLRISSTAVSATNISVTTLMLNGVSSSSGVSLTVSGDNLGNHAATQDLTMGGYNITGAAAVSATGTLKTTAALQSGNTDTTCSASGDYGKMRFDAATKSLYLCRQ